MMRTILVSWQAFDRQLNRYKGVEEILAQDTTEAEIELRKKLFLKFGYNISIDILDIKRKGE